MSNPWLAPPYYSCKDHSPLVLGKHSETLNGPVFGMMGRRLGRISSGPGSHSLQSLLTAWVCCKKPVWTPVFLFASAATARTGHTRCLWGGGGTHLLVPPLSCFYYLSHSPRMFFLFLNFFFLFHFRGPWGLGSLFSPASLI